MYAASKAGLEAMTEALQLEVAEDGVHLLSLDPGTSLFLRTSMGTRQAGHYQTMENNLVPHKTEAFETTKTILSHVKGPELHIIQDDNIMGYSTVQYSTQDTTLSINLKFDTGYRNSESFHHLISFILQRNSIM